MRHVKVVAPVAVPLLSCHLRSNLAASDASISSPGNDLGRNSARASRVTSESCAAKPYSIVPSVLGTNAQGDGRMVKFHVCTDDCPPLSLDTKQSIPGSHPELATNAIVVVFVATIRKSIIFQTQFLGKFNCNEKEELLVVILAGIIVDPANRCIPLGCLKSNGLFDQLNGSPLSEMFVSMIAIS